MLKLIIGAATHGGALAIGFALGVYFLPILTAPTAPEAGYLEKMASNAQFKAELTRALADSDFLHWGEGTISISSDQVIHEGSLAPGPDYKLYLVPEFVETEADFLAIKDQARVIGDVKTFEGFAVDVPANVDIEAYTTVLVWCEAFSEFITAGKYR